MKTYHGEIMERIPYPFITDPARDSMLEELQELLAEGSAAIVGPPGSGRSTWLRSLADLLRRRDDRCVLLRPCPGGDLGGHLWLTGAAELGPPSYDPDDVVVKRYLERLGAGQGVAVLLDGFGGIVESARIEGPRLLWWLNPLFENATVLFAGTPMEWRALELDFGKVRKRYGLKRLPPMRTLPPFGNEAAEAFLVTAAELRAKARGLTVDPREVREGAAQLVSFGAGLPFYLEALGVALADTHGQGRRANKARSFYLQNLVRHWKKVFEERWEKALRFRHPTPQKKSSIERSLAKALEVLASGATFAELPEQERAVARDRGVFTEDGWIDRPFVDWYATAKAKTEKVGAAPKRVIWTAAVTHSLARTTGAEVTAGEAPILRTCIRYHSPMDVVLRDGHLYCCHAACISSIELATGVVAWQRLVDHVRYSARILVTGDLVIVSTKSAVLGLDRRMGTIRYQIRSPRATIAAGGSWLWVLREGELRCYDVTSGRERKGWSIPKLTSDEPHLRPRAIAATSDGVLVLSQAIVARLSAAGKDGAEIQWKTDFEGSLAQIVVSDEALIVFERSSILRLDPLTGAVIWQRRFEPQEAYGTATPHPQVGLFAETVVLKIGELDEPRRLIALNLQDGAELWNVPAMGHPGVGTWRGAVVDAWPPEPEGDTSIPPPDELQAFAPRTSNLLWTVPFPDIATRARGLERIWGGDDQWLAVEAFEDLLLFST